MRECPAGSWRKPNEEIIKDRPALGRLQYRPVVCQKDVIVTRASIMKFFQCRMVHMNNRLAEIFSGENMRIPFLSGFQYSGDGFDSIYLKILVAINHDIGWISNGLEPNGNVTLMMVHLEV
jgi:hypothetical protein